MSRIVVCVALAALLAAAGCASSPELTAEAPAAATSAATTAAVSAEGTLTVVDANELIAREPAPVRCREILKPNSNVHVLQCMTAEAWRVYDRAEARRAAELVRMMQGGAYR